MSRFVELHVALGSLDEVASALAALGVDVERADEPLMLRGGIECGDAPVELRVAAGARESVEDFGFIRGSNGDAVLVCGEPDRSRLERTLVAPLVAEITRARLVADPTLQVDAAVVDADGGVRVRIRRR